MNPPLPIAALLGRPWFVRLSLALLTLPYWWSGLAKLADTRGAVAEARGLGFGHPGMIVAGTIAVQLVGSFLIISNRSAWLGAGALAVFTAIATLLAHGFWTISDPVDRFHAFNTFLEHIGLIAGFMLVAILAQQAASTGGRQRPSHGSSGRRKV